jgi:hypothetical protein
MAHVSSWREFPIIHEAKDGFIENSVESRPVIDVDFVLAFEADLQSVPPREIQIRWFRQLISMLREKHFPIGMVSYDGFQSTDSIQILTAMGITAKPRSIDKTDDAWRTLRDLAAESRVTMPNPRLLRVELEGLTKLINGKVDHPAKTGSKDLADAVAGSILGALELGGQEVEEEEYDAMFDSLSIRERASDQDITQDDFRWGSSRNYDFAS